MNLPRQGFALLVVVGVLLAAGLIVYLYRREGKTLSRRARMWLGGMRMAAMLGVLVMLLEPAIVFVKREEVPSQLVVLVDESESMDLKDAYADGAGGQKIADALKMASVDEVRETTRRGLVKRAMESGLLKKLEESGDRVVVVHGFAGQLMPVASVNKDGTTGIGDKQTQKEAATQSGNNGETGRPYGRGSELRDRSTTGVGTAIEEALAAYRGKPMAGILLLTDGQSNSGEPVKKAGEAAAAEGVPVVAVAVGTPEGPRNAKMVKIDVSPVVFVRDVNQANLVMESRGLAGHPATVILEKLPDGGTWEEIGRKTVVLEESGALQTVVFDFREDRPTKITLKATIADVGPELTTADNVAMAEVRAIRQKIKVLFIAGHPFPEFEFVRNSLLRDQAISAATWLQTAGKDYDQPGTPAIKRLPETQEELNDFDCVVMYDPDPMLWPEHFPQMLVDFVGKAGGGLIDVAGERFTKDYFERPDDPNSAWLALMPVVAEPGLYRTDVTAKLSARNAWKLEVTPEGHADPVFQFADKPEENDRILAALPGMYWHYPVTRAKAGATVLARHADPRMRNEYGNHVLLATQLVGPGRTFFVGFDSTYRWRFLDEQTFDGFWARMVDRAGRSKQLGGRYPYALTTDRASYRPGSMVTLVARFENPADKDTGLDQMHGEVEGPDEAPLPITLFARKGEPAAFEATFAVTKAGPHFVKVWAGDVDAKQVVRAATLEFPVELPNLEYDQPTVNLVGLWGLTKATGGAVLDVSEMERAPGMFKVKRVTHVLEDRQTIFNAPVLFGAVLVFLFVEWLLRKKYRLV